MQMQQPPMTMGAPNFDPRNGLAGIMGGMMTSDPSLKCHVEDCQMMGLGNCHWYNCICLCSKRSSGCGKRVCQAHRCFPKYCHDFRTNKVISDKQMHKFHFVCQDCEAEVTQDMSKNRRCKWTAFCSIFLVLLCAVLIPVLLTADERAEWNSHY